MVVESTATPRVQLGGRPADSSHRARAATGREAALSSCTRGSSTACNRPRRHNGKSRTLAVAAECGWRGRRRGRSGPGRKPGARQGAAAGARGRGSNEAGECRGQSGGAHAACKRRSPGAVKRGATAAVAKTRRRMGGVGGAGPRRSAGRKGLVDRGSHEAPVVEIERLHMTLAPPPRVITLGRHCSSRRHRMIAMSAAVLVLVLVPVIVLVASACPWMRGGRRTLLRPALALPAPPAVEGLLARLAQDLQPFVVQAEIRPDQHDRRIDG